MRLIGPSTPLQDATERPQDDDKPLAIADTASAGNELAAWLSQRMAQRWRVVVTTNQTRLASVNRQSEVWILRIAAPLVVAEAWDDVLDYIKGGNVAVTQRLRARAEAEGPLLPGRWRPSPKVERHHVLSTHVEAIVARYFAGAAPARVSWAVGSQARGGRGRTIELGCFVAHTRRVLIDPRLDHPEVPVVYLRFVIYHELLHATFERAGHCNHHRHDRRFRAAEAEFEGYNAALAWERTVLLNWLQEGSGSVAAFAEPVPG